LAVIITWVGVERRLREKRGRFPQDLIHHHIRRRPT
jgi:hypothetical protein